MPTLYIVATPIGNLEDISLRALRILNEVALIAAEDSRKTRRLLATYGIRKPLTSYHEHNKKAKLSYLLSRLESEDIALVSEAGMPGISDPGYELVVAASERGIPIVPIPGPSVLVTALAVSALPTKEFIYLGFLPRRKGQRRHLLHQVAEGERTIIAFEAPHRLVATLGDI
ncbi:MAG: 16S rRNA (cytidine(1402)-2'-O)-methyltransferase, partial [Dehalococcoidia bacterium]